jgi:hypothetical protein
MIKPKGGKKRPAIKPIFVPQMPYFEPPKYFVPLDGMT